MLSLVRFSNVTKKAEFDKLWNNAEQRHIYCYYTKQHNNVHSFMYSVTSIRHVQDSYKSQTVDMKLFTSLRCSNGPIHLMKAFCIILIVTCNTCLHFIGLDMGQILIFDVLFTYQDLSWMDVILGFYHRQLECILTPYSIQLDETLKCMQHHLRKISIGKKEYVHKIFDTFF